MPWDTAIPLKGPTGPTGPGSFTLNPAGTYPLQLSNTSVSRFSNGAPPDWDTAFYSSEEWYSLLYLYYNAGQTDAQCMGGFSETPQASVAFANMNYGFFMNQTAGWEIYESGSPVGFTGTYSTSTLFGVTYDGSYVRYLVDGTEVNKTTRSIGNPLYLFMPFAYDGSINDIRYGTFGIGPTGETGPTGDTGPTGETGPTGDTGPTGVDFQYVGPTGSILFYDGTQVTGSTGLTYTVTDTGGTGGMVIAGDILPTQSNVFSLGATGTRWKEVFMGPGTLNIEGPSGSNATLGSDLGGVAYTAKGFATPFITIGPSIADPLEPGAIGGWKVGPTGTIGTVDYDLVAIHSDASGTIYGPTGGVSLLTSKAPTTICASAYSTSSQTIAVNVSENLEHSVVDFAYGITVATGPTGYFQVPSAGVYKIIPSLQLNATSGGDIHVWMKVNGTNVPNTTTYLTFKNNEKQVFTTEILLQLNANDQVQVWVQASIHGPVIQYIAAGGTGPNTYPAAPGIITNMYKLR
jgi:hypothetical protein